MRTPRSRDSLEDFLVTGRRLLVWLIAGSLALFTGCARQPSENPENPLTVAWGLSDS